MMRSAPRLKFNLSQAIIRNLFLLMVLGTLLCIFPFKGVWAGYEVFQYTGCTNYTAAPNTEARCDGSATCKYVSVDGGIIGGMEENISLWVAANSLCSTAPVKNTARIYSYVQDSAFTGLYGEAMSTVVGLPYFFILI